MPVCIAVGSGQPLQVILKYGCVTVKESAKLINRFFTPAIQHTVTGRQRLKPEYHRRQPPEIAEKRQPVAHARRQRGHGTVEFQR